MQTYDTSVLSLSPWVYLKLNETSGTTATDYSGNGRHGSYQNGMVLANAGTPVAGVTENGPTATAASLHYANVPLTGGFMAAAKAAGGFSISAWFKSSTGVGFTCGTTAGGQQINLFRNGGFNNPNLYVCTLTTPTAGQTQCTDNITVPALNDGNWHHLVFVCGFAGIGSWCLSVDGVVCPQWGGGTKNLDATLLVEPTMPMAIQAIGTGNPGAANLVNGSPMHFAMFARPLTTNECRKLYEDAVHLRTRFTRVPKTYTSKPEIWWAIGKKMKTQRVEEHRFGDSTSTIPGGNGGNSLHAEAAMFRSLSGTETPGCQWISANSADGLFARTYPQIWTDVSITSTLPPGLQVFESVSGGNPHTLSFDTVGFAYLAGDAASAAHGEVLVPDTVTIEVIAQKKIGSGPLDLIAYGLSVPFGYPGMTRANIYPTTELFSAAELGNADNSFVKKTVTIKTFGFQFIQFQTTYRTAGARVASFRCYDPNKPGRIISSFSAGGYQSSHFIANHNSCGPMLQAIGVPDFVSIDLGTNDEINSNSSDTYKANMVALIANLRAKYNSPTLPVLLLSHPIQANVTTTKKLLGNEYAQALYEIAQADPYTAFINVRRCLYESGWNHDNTTYSATAWTNGESVTVGMQRTVPVSGSYSQVYQAIAAHSAGHANRPPNAANWVQLSQWLIDGVHYSPIGGTLKGGTVATLMGRLMSGADAYDADVAAVASNINSLRIVTAR